MEWDSIVTVHPPATRQAELKSLIDLHHAIDAVKVGENVEIVVRGRTYVLELRAVAASE